MWLRLLEFGHRLLLLLLLLLLLKLLLLLLPSGLLIVGEALRVRLGDLLFWVHDAFVLAFVLMLAVMVGRGRMWMMRQRMGEQRIQGWGIGRVLMVRGGQAKIERFARSRDTWRRQ
jgi:hypothetical protein